jgi:two-component system, sensor histidine kinase LadS
MSVHLRRYFMFHALWALLFLQQMAFAQTAVINLPSRSVMIPSVVSAFQLPLDQALDPEAIWQAQQTITQPANAQGRWGISAGKRTAAKFALSTQKDHIFTIEVPLVRMDKVELFWRLPGQAWEHAQAGDTVALSQWPMVGQYPTFVMHFEATTATMDVLMVMQNAGTASTAVYLNADRESRERRLLQANVAGLLIGASAMVLVISLLLFLMYRNRSSACLLVYCTAITMGTSILNGYAALWFTPDWPAFNDAAKPFLGSVISAAMLAASTNALDRVALGRRARYLAWVVVCSVLVYGVAQAIFLHPQWRLLGGAAGALVCALTAIVLAVAAWQRGDGHAPWVMLSALLFTGSAVVVSFGYVQIAGMDLFAVLMTLLLVASSLVLRHVLVVRERFGRAVAGRENITRFRDPLTALLSYDGFERAVDNLAVRQHSGGGVAHILYFSLTALDSFRHEDGYLVWQRDLVRFAAVLQKSLGVGWHIARLSNSKFGAVRLDDHGSKTNESLLTLVLSSCARKIDTEGWADRVGLRMTGASTPLTTTGLQDILRVLEQTVRDLPAGKRIALL